VISNDSEAIALRRRIDVLLDEARKNEDAWQRSHRREMELLEAESLGELLDRLTRGLRISFRLTTATLVLTDPQFEVRHLLMAQGQPLKAYPSVLFVDSASDLPPSSTVGRCPWLGRYNPADHAVLFPGAAHLKSVALLPLVREGRIIGSLNFGSGETGRFTNELATDFLRHLAVIAAFCLESAVNRARLVRSGITDVLTGWHNRRYLQTRLHEELARSQREGGALSCLMIDVDHFKQVNDLYGHLAGDDVLQQLARRINAEVRESDVSARYGGEEFVILLPATGIDATRMLAERIRRAVSSEGFVLDAVPESLPITVSIGIAEHRPGSNRKDLVTAGQELLARADLGLYQAKEGGRNRVGEAAGP
jgi:diguanylate cyclase (GGDEF)-like protein